MYVGEEKRIKNKSRIMRGVTRNGVEIRVISINCLCSIGVKGVVCISYKRKAIKKGGKNQKERWKLERKKKVDIRRKKSVM